jgi:trehalose 6-phosphate synthase
VTLVIDSALKIGVLSRRAPIGQSADFGTTIEHVGGLTRVLPALAEFAEIAWTTLATQSQIGLPKKYSFAKLSRNAYQHDISIFLTEVDALTLNQSDWFCTHYIWPLLHDLPIPELDAVELTRHLDSIKSICQAVANNCADLSNDGYLVNDFQLSQVPSVLREFEPRKPITFFLHTPWPKTRQSNNLAIEILQFLATGMLAADVIEFQTQKDLQAFEKFIIDYLPAQLIDTELKVNPVSVNVQDLKSQSTTLAGQIDFHDDDVSYVHIARSDPIKNTLATIRAFTEIARLNESQARKFLDLLIVPSRQQWPQYQELLAEIADCVEVCNAQLGSLSYLPIRLHVGNDYDLAIQALTRYDYLLVCSVADGLNLVVKEGAILNTRNGVIISTANVGAMAELGNFCVLADGADEPSIVRALEVAEKLDSNKREEMSVQLKEQIKEFDASHWAQSVIASLKVLQKV